MKKSTTILAALILFISCTKQDLSKERHELPNHILKSEQLMDVLKVTYDNGLTAYGKDQGNGKTLILLAAKDTAFFINFSLSKANGYMEHSFTTVDGEPLYSLKVSETGIITDFSMTSNQRLLVSMPYASCMKHIIQTCQASWLCSATCGSIAAWSCTLGWGATCAASAIIN